MWARVPVVERASARNEHAEMRQCSLTWRTAQNVAKHAGAHAAVVITDAVPFPRDEGTIIQPVRHHLRYTPERTLLVRQGLHHPGLPEIRFHDLRYSYATLARRSGMDIKDLSVRLSAQPQLGPSDNIPKPALTSVNETCASVPGVGVEPTRPRGPRFLGALRLPFRHPGCQHATSAGTRCQNPRIRSSLSWSRLWT